MRTTYLYLIIGLILVGIIAIFGHPEATDFTSGQMTSLVYLGLVLLLIMNRARFKNMGSRKDVFEAVGLWVSIAALLAVVYTFQDDMKRAGQRVVAAFSGQSVQTFEGKKVVLSKIDTHFTANVGINNKTPFSMMVDTGASLIALSYEDAQALGLPVELLIFDRETNTANGKAMSAAVTLDVVRLGDIEVTRVRALVAQRNALKGSLLGMSFLERLQSYSVVGGQMVLIGK